MYMLGEDGSLIPITMEKVPTPVTIEGVNDPSTTASVGFVEEMSVNPEAANILDSVISRTGKSELLKTAFLLKVFVRFLLCL